MVLDLKGRCLVQHETASTGKMAQIASLFAVGLEFIWIGSLSFHGLIMLRSMSNAIDIRLGRHCALNLHVHLVFVTDQSDQMIATTP